MSAVQVVTVNSQHLFCLHLCGFKLLRLVLELPMLEILFPTTQPSLASLLDNTSYATVALTGGDVILGAAYGQGSSMTLRSHTITFLPPSTPRIWISFVRTIAHLPQPPPSVREGMVVLGVGVSC